MWPVIILFVVILMLEVLIVILLYTASRMLRKERRASNLRLWLTSEVESYPYRVVVGVSVMLMISVVGTWSLSGMGSPSLRYIKEGYRKISLDVYGGKQEIDRAINIYNELEMFDYGGYDSLDIKAMTLYVTATSFKETFEQIITDKNTEGTIRILILNPLMSLRSETRGKFDDIAKGFGQSGKELFAECWLTVVFLEMLKRDLGDRFQVRAFDSTIDMRNNEYILQGRSYHKYNKSNLQERFDIIVPYGNKDEEGKDSNERVAWRIKNRNNDTDVKKHTVEFEEFWKDSIPLKEVSEELSKKFTVLRYDE